MSRRIDKKSTMILTNKENQTFNAYRRIINSTMSKKDYSFTSKECDNFSIKSVLNEVKNSNFKSPFLRGEKRFVWQDNNNQNKNINAIELKGTEMVKPIIKHSINCFENFYDLTKELPIAKHRRTTSVHITTNQRKIMENLNSSRKSIGGRVEDEVRSKKILENRKHETTGSIKLLLDKTPEYNLKNGRRIYNKSLNSSINIFSDEYQNERSPTPTGKKFVVPAANNELSAGLQTKFQYTEVFKGYQDPSTYMKKKMFPGKLQVILGGSSKVIPFSNRNKDSLKYPLEYTFVASTPQTKLSTVTPCNEWSNRNNVNFSVNNTYNMDGLNTPKSNKHCFTDHVYSSQKYMNINTLEGKNLKTDYPNNASMHNERSNRTYFY